MSDLKGCVISEDEIKTLASWLRTYRRWRIRELKRREGTNNYSDDLDLDEIARVKQFIEERLGEEL